MNTLRSTTLSVGLLHTPIKLVNATSKMSDINFAYVGPDGQPVERVYRDKETLEVFSHDELGKAYEGHQIDKDRLAEVEEASTKDEAGNDLTAISVDFFMPIKEVPMERAENLYYIAPNGKPASQSLLHFMEGLKKRKVAAVAKIVVKSRQKLLVIFPDGDNLKAVSLRFEEAIVPADSSVTIEGKVQRPVLDLMNTLIDSTMGSVDDLVAMEDTFTARKRELVDEVIASGTPTKKAKPQKHKPATGLLEALEESVKAAQGKVSA